MEGFFFRERMDNMDLMTTDALGVFHCSFFLFFLSRPSVVFPLLILSSELLDQVLSKKVDVMGMISELLRPVHYRTKADLTQNLRSGKPAVSALNLRSDARSL
jgi:hypothetical protein